MPQAATKQSDNLLGHNMPPTDADPLLGRLREDNADLLERRDVLLGACERAPGEISDEETAGKMADFVQKEIDPFLKRAKDVHQSEKEPFLSAGRTVDGFWHTLIDDLEGWKKKLNAVRKKYADEKAAAERKRREEEARRAEEEAERKRIEAEEALRAADDVGDIDAAIAAEEKAIAAQRAADKAAAAAAAKPAELGRSRGASGGLTTLRAFWTHSDLNRDTIDLEALRPHISTEALDKAVKSFINAGGRELRGVRIYEDTRV